jgi:hypothetical protein
VKNRVLHGLFRVCQLDLFELGRRYILFAIREFNLEMKHRSVVIFAPEGRDVYSLTLPTTTQRSVGGATSK